MSASKHAGKGAGAMRHQVRIVGGRWRGTRLGVASADGLRPTPDRVRETLFNWLGQDLTGWRCVDAFAGTGALGLEAASRGAARVLLVERDAALAGRLQQAVQRLHAEGVQVRRGDGVAALASCARASLDLVLIDPPFEAAQLGAAALAAAARALAERGFVYLEAPARWDATLLAERGYLCHRYLRAGAVHAHLLVQRRAGVHAAGGAAAHEGEPEGPTIQERRQAP